MKRSYCINEDHDVNFSKRVALVDRNPEPCGIGLISTVAVGKKAPNDLVDLAMEIQKADSFIQANACNKLQMIAQQVRFLQQQATKVLEEMKINSDLHHAACNFVKVPGNTYHLYTRPLGQNYFSMLSPQEWTYCPHEYMGSFRLEQDHSWTPVQSIHEKDVQLSLINKILMTKEEISLPLTLQHTKMDI